MKGIQFFCISLILLLGQSCTKSRQSKPGESVFIYYNKQSGDTAKFYAYKNLDTAIYHARLEKKNILLIFSGYACMSESDLEWKTLSLFGDNDKIQNNFILAWLAVDDSTMASDTGKIVNWHGKERRLLRVGDGNKYFEETTFKLSTQPTFCFMDTLKRPFGMSISYTNDKREVGDFLFSGMAH